MAEIDDCLISLITVCLNSGKTIEKTFESVLEQTYPYLEYQVVDGGSTDGTIELIREYEPRFKKAGIQFSWTSEADNGLYDAMNKGIARSRGELIGIINSDDWYEPEAAELAFRAYSNAKGNVNYGMLRIWRGEKEYAIRQFHHNFLQEQVTQHPTMFIPKAIYEKHDVFSPKYKYYGDYELLLRFRSQGVGFSKIDQVMANFRTGGYGYSNSHKSIFEKLEIKRNFNIISQKQYLFLRSKHLVLYFFKVLLKK